MPINDEPAARVNELRKEECFLKGLDILAEMSQK